MSGRLKLCVVVLTCGLAGSVAAAQAKTIKAATCDQKDVQVAIAAAADGDIVEVPAGEAVWTTDSSNKPAVLIDNKTITLQGAGVDKTVITDGTTFAWKNLLLWIRGPKPARVTGFTFKGIEGRNPGAAAIAIHGACKSWRVDNCKFDKSPRGVWAYADCFGLVDNCSFLHAGQGVVMTGNGDRSWEEPLALGLANAVYAEDCTFEGTRAVTDAYGGARYVFRHNSVIGGTVTHHGCDSGDYRSPVSFEVYDSLIENRPEDRWNIPRAMHFRGGTGVVFNNTIRGFGVSIDVANYRSSEAMRQLCGKWGICDGRNPIDGNEEPNGYPAQDQIGRATNQILEPLYQWNNALDGKPAAVSVSTGAQHIKENRDFYNATPRPGYKPYQYPHPLRQQWPPAPPEDREPPTVPQNITARAISEKQVELTWETSKDNVATTGYYVWLNGARVTAITDPACTHYAFLRLKLPAAEYTFGVSAFDAAGNESQQSGPVSCASGARASSSTERGR